MSNNDKELARIYREYQSRVDYIRETTEPCSQTEQELEEEAFAEYVARKAAILRQRGSIQQ